MTPTGGAPKATPAKSPALNRFIAAHFIAYPIALIWAVGAIPLVLLTLSHDALYAGAEQASKIVVVRLAWPAGISFVLAHLTAIPWAMERGDASRKKKMFVLLDVALGAIGMVVGAIAWIRLILH